MEIDDSQVDLFLSLRLVSNSDRQSSVTHSQHDYQPEKILEQVPEVNMSRENSYVPVLN